MKKSSFFSRKNHRFFRLRTRSPGSSFISTFVRRFSGSCVSTSAPNRRIIGPSGWVRIVFSSSLCVAPFASQIWLPPRYLQSEREICQAKACITEYLRERPIKRRHVNAKQTASTRTSPGRRSTADRTPCAVAGRTLG